MHLGLFPWIAMAGWLLFLPGSFWQAVGACFNTPFGRTLSARGQQAVDVSHDWLPNILAGALLLYVVAWNVRELDFDYWEPRLLPKRLNVIGRTAGLAQRWDLFAPFPMRNDGWYVMEGTLANGRKVNLWDEHLPLPWQKPADVAATYKNRRWRKYLLNMRAADERGQRVFLADWLRRRWNRTHEDPSERVLEVRLVFQLEWPPEPGASDFPPEAVLLGRWNFTSRETRSAETH
jgi:hypothetical protein